MIPLFAVAAALLVQDTLPPVPRRMLADVRYLADTAREGRGVGTRGLREAGQYIADKFKQAGVAPANSDGSYFQTFVISPDAPAAMHTKVAGDTTRNVVAVL